MANTRYNIRSDTQANMHADVKAALLDYYGAYNDPANLDGVDILYDTSPYLIFTCTAIADKPIRFYAYGSLVRRPFWSYGSAYTAGTDVDDALPFAGSYEINNATYLLTSAVYLALGPHTLLMSALGTNRLLSVLTLIGQLSNSDYAVLGMVGVSSTTYNVGCAGYNTTDGTPLYPVALEAGFQSAAGKLYTQALILKHGTVGVELNGDGSIASFQDVYNVSHVTGTQAAVWGATFVLTHCQLYLDGGVSVLPTALLMEYEEVT